MRLQPDPGQGRRGWSSLPSRARLGTRAGAWWTRSGTASQGCRWVIGSRRCLTTATPSTTWPRRTRSSRLPASLAGQPFPGEPLGCAMNIFRRSGIEAGQTVAIVGIGFLGAILTRLAAHAGARVIAVSRRPFRSTSPATWARPRPSRWMTTTRIIARVKELTGGRLLRPGDRGGRQAVAARPRRGADARSAAG